jgi:transcriptional regulator with XRE-family HTH domain
MPKGKQHTDPRILAAIPQIRAYMQAQGHAQPKVAELSGQAQSQVSRLLTGQRSRVTPAIRAICQYANVDIDSAPAPSASELRLSQAVRQLVVDNPRGEAVLARLIEVLGPALALMRDPPATSAAKEHP